MKKKKKTKKEETPKLKKGNTLSEYNRTGKGHGGIMSLQMCPYGLGNAHIDPETGESYLEEE